MHYVCSGCFRRNVHDVLGEILVATNPDAHDAYPHVFGGVLFFLSSGGWIKIKLKLPHFHVSDTSVSI